MEEKGADNARKVHVVCPLTDTHVRGHGPGLSLRGRGRGFPPATMRVIPGYFHKKIEEK